MSLLKEMLVEILHKENISIDFGISKEQIVKLFSDTCFRALARIKAIVENDDLDDFGAIEEIICVLEELGSNGGNRHDFG